MQYVNGIRCLHGNFVISKDDFGRGLLKAIHAGGTVGILMDTNMTPPQGEFVPFFGVDACTGTGLAHIARQTGAAVLPGIHVLGAGRAPLRAPLRSRGRNAAHRQTAPRIFWKARGVRRL